MKKGRLLCLVGVCAFLCGFYSLDSHAALTDPAVRHDIKASGGGTLTEGTLRLSFTVGEPVIGEARGQRYRVIAGFQALFLPPQEDPEGLDGGSIFRDSFEDIPPQP